MGYITLRKKKYKCSICPYQKRLPLTYAVLYAYLIDKDKFERDVVDVYLILMVETYQIVFVDFDNEGY